MKHLRFFKKSLIIIALALGLGVPVAAIPKKEFSKNKYIIINKIDNNEIKIHSEVDLQGRNQDFRFILNILRRGLVMNVSANR